MNMSLIDIKEQALWELELEVFEAAVEAEKVELRTHKPWWKKVFPYTITITKDKEK